MSPVASDRLLDRISRRVADIEGRTTAVDVRGYVGETRPTVIRDILVSFTDQSGGTAHHYIYRRELGETVSGDRIANLDPGDTDQTIRLEAGSWEIGVSAHDGAGNESSIVWDQVTV